MIKMKDIIREGNPQLTKKSAEVTLPFSKTDEKTLKLMVEYIKNSLDQEIAEKYQLRPAAGLSAVQINVLKRMLVILTTDEKNNEHFYAMVNPKLISYSDELTYLPSGEGCLSVDREVSGYVHRARRIKVETLLYRNGLLEPAQLQLKGYLAIVFLHELDHLNGILFTDRINDQNPYYLPHNSVPVVFEDDPKD